MRQYPDPDRVVYPTTLPPTFPCQQTMRTSSRAFPIHNHDAWLDREGDGNTGVDAGHFHRIRDGRVLPDLTDGHTHEMTDLPCGAGGAHQFTRNDGPVTFGAGPQVITDPNFDMCAGIADQAQRDACRLQQIQQQNRFMQLQSEGAQKRLQRNILIGVGLLVVAGAAVGAVMLMRSE